MKILILANNDIGLYKFRKELIEKLLEQHKVFVSLPDGQFVSDLTKLGCTFIDTKIDRRGMNPINDLSLIKMYLSQIRKVKPDLVITYTIKPNVYGGFAARILHTNYAMNITGLGTAFQTDNLTKKIACFLYKRATKRAKCVFFENEGNKEVFMQNGLVKHNQGHVLHGAGANLEEYTMTAYPADDKVTRFLFIGRVMKEKGIDEFLNVAEQIKKEKTNVEFDIVGPMEDDYKQRLEELDKKKIIHYYGFQTDVKPFIRNCHCFVLPSYHEGMANTLLECASMGRPLITSDIYGCKEAVFDNGYLCKVKNTEDLYIQMNKFLELSYKDKVQMGINSRKHMEAMFDKTKIVKETIEWLLR